jgi:hypothetical protein
MRPIEKQLKARAIAILLAVVVGTPAFAQSAPQEGIKVHGDWTLTVRNADGTVAAVHEFKNALNVSFGADVLLARLLGGQAVTGHWLIFLHPSSPPGCNPVNQACAIVEGGSPSGADSRDLTRTIPTTGPDAGKLVLRGSVRVPVGLSIVQVTTNVAVCNAPASAGACVASSSAPVTRRNLETPVPVAADQLVEVKVVISFS